MSKTPTNSYVRQAGRFFLINLPVSLVICLPFFMRSLHDHETPLTVNVLMFVSSVVFLNLLFYGFISLVAFFRLPQILMRMAAATAASAFHLFLIIDYRVFSVFKFHINGLILNFLTTEGAGDSFRLSTATLVTLGLIVSVLCAAEFMLATRVFSTGAGEGRRLRIALILGVSLSLIAADKAVYAYAELTNRSSVLQNSRYYPYYITLKVRGFAGRWFGYQAEKWDEVVYPDSGRTLNYPLQPLSFSADAPRHNVLFIVLECMRQDMITPEVMPNLDAFSKKHFVFRDHYSGGNATRWGIFSMFYGLYGSLWHQFLAARQGPVLIDSLIKKDYQFSILSATKLTFPEFRKTVFVDVPNEITDDWQAVHYSDRDRLMTERFDGFLKSRDPKRPFMGFLFFNSSHPYFEYPPQFNKFHPVVENPDAIDLTRAFTPEQYAGFKNRYKNSLFYLDSLIQKILTDLQKAGAFENTIIVITGDHGSEYNENGYFFYNSAFDDYQLKPPLIMSVPGKKPQEITMMTSHVDLAPTLLTLLGSTTPPSAYSHGIDLFAPTPRSSILCSDWGHFALVTDKYRIIMPSTSGFADQRMEVRTGNDYKIVQDKTVLKQYLPEIVKAMNQNASFLK
jgi:membrane-anchored protein YejM (alkaline phosphatase superfamily)